jgi:hypothetical protein
LHLRLQYSEVPAGKALGEGYEEGALLETHWKRGRERVLSLINEKGSEGEEGKGR